MSIKRDIEYAIYIHGAWKTRFRDFLSGRAPMDLSVVGQSHACKLGHWLDNEARRMLSPEDHAEACRLHAHFHQVSGDIVDCIKRKDFETARQTLVPAGSFDQASHGLAAYLRKMPLRHRSKTSAPPETEASKAA
ncbi:MAG: CZB domain-containing protein [Thiobacillus sp.]|nr:CZB domain-containing protein [Thiobacillus sp.]